jgi:chemotaxis protein CheD
MQPELQIEVGMAKIEIAEAPYILFTRGLGSCVGIVIYDPHKKIGGLAHAMLPTIHEARFKTNPAKFVDSAIAFMIEHLEQKGCARSNLQAKLVGGSHMFKTIPENSTLDIGMKNVKASQDTLTSYGIKIVSQDTRGNYGRTVFFDLNTGKINIRTIFVGEKEI